MHAYYPKIGAVQSAKVLLAMDDYVNINPYKLLEIIPSELAVVTEYSRTISLMLSLMIGYNLSDCRIVGDNSEVSLKNMGNAEMP